MELKTQDMKPGPVRRDVKVKCAAMAQIYSDTHLMFLRLTVQSSF